MKRYQLRLIGNPINAATRQFTVKSQEGSPLSVLGGGYLDDLGYCDFTFNGNNNAVSLPHSDFCLLQ